MKALLQTLLSLLFMLGSLPAHADDDWRREDSEEEKLEKIIKVLPGTSDIMFQMGHRYRNLYWAAKQGKWEFAEYQIEEMQSLIRKLIITRPKRRATASNFLAYAFNGYEDAIEKRDWPRFRKAFDKMRQACERCHKQNNHGFISLQKVPLRGTSPALD